MTDDSFIRREVARLQQAVQQLQHDVQEREQAFALIMKIVVRPNEEVTGAEVIKRVERLALALVDRTAKLGALESAVRDLGPCDVDAVGACHSHGQMTQPCPVGVCLGLCRRLPTTILARPKVAEA